jgi:HAD superfamily hydrolase (TIGR01509 family)
MKTILVDAVFCFVVERDSKWVAFDEMYKMLENFPNKKILLTGANDEKFLTFGLDKMPYEVFTLKNNPAKSDPKYYETFLEKYNFKSNEVIYFEHNEVAAKSAESVGIKTYLYDQEKEDVDALKTWLTDNL